MNSEYAHPGSGRVYREGDPAHYFAQLVRGLARECEEFLHYYGQGLEGRDYLAQFTGWLGDPDRIARSMAYTIGALDKAYTAVTVDRHAHEYGLGKQDEEWHRKYGAAKRPADPR